MDVSTRALIEAVVSQAPAQDPLVLLETAVMVAEQVGRMADGMVDHYVGAARAAGLSWTVIGERLGVSKQAARQRFSPRVEGESGTAVSGELPAVAPRLSACLEVAHAAAEAEGTVAGTQHLLLGLLHVGVAANVLDRLGVTREAVTEASARLLTSRDADGGRVAGDGEAESAVERARRFAAGRGQNLTLTEHLLFVLALDAGSSARRLLDDLGVEPARVKKGLADVLPPPPRSGRRGRRTGKPDRDGLACSFCGCTDADRVMVSGPGVRICSECVVLATEIVATTEAERLRG
ncbi:MULTISPECIES: ClpX C4-type zinc finger protein [unclassified Kribbella]|uniref:ClpX C4-type zinc finger protein n=1 Tax=unclassified Kribbella TaxID=2644121 RepID=UPI003019DF52